MSKLLFPILVLCLAAWLFGGAAWFGSHFSLPKANEQWHLQDGKHSFTAPNRIAFPLNSRDLLTNNAQENMLHEIAEHLSQNPERYLRLTGIYTEQEINDSDRPNLGIARAESIQNLIYRSGVIDLERLEIQHKKIEEHQLNPYGLIDGGVLFEFFESPLLEYGPDFRLNKELFFEQATDVSIKKDIGLDRYVQSLRQYLADHPEQNVTIKSYHTDITKDAIAQKRVDNMIELFTTSGIAANRLNTDFESLGEAASLKGVDGYLEIRIY
jgi:hypothetical protein